MTVDQLKAILASPAKLDALFGLRCPSRVFFDQFTPTNVTHQILPFSKDRMALLFIPPTAGNVTLGNDPITGVGLGLSITASAGPVLLLASQVGMCVQLPWHLLSSGVGVQASWIEVNFPLDS